MNYPTDQGNPAGAIPVYITAGGGSGSIAGTPAGFEQIADLSAVETLTVPIGATSALIQAEAQNVRWTNDGTDPTSSAGMLIYTGTSVQFYGSLNALKFIEATSGAILNISYFA